MKNPMAVFHSESYTDLSPCRKNIFAIIAIFLIIIICYSNTFHASWHFDDEKFLRQKTLHLTKLTWPEIKKVFKGQNEFYRPVASFSLALNYYFDRDNVFGYHLFNQSIHFLTSIFLFLFIFHTLNFPSFSSSYRKNAYAIALLSTILWTINPVHTQAVTYITQRMASLAGMFYIMAMYLYLKGRTTSQRNKKIIFYFLSVIAFIFSFGSKENSILLPVSLLFLEILVFQEGPLLKRFNKNIKFFVITMIGTIAIVFLYLYFIKGGDPFSFLGGYEHRIFSLKERLLTEPRVLLFYISLLFYPMPTRLCLSHDISLSQSMLNPPGTLFAILLILFLITGGLAISKRSPLMIYCIIFFFLNHMVESTIIPLELIFEHRNYIPSMLIFIPLATLFLEAISRFTNQKIMRNIIISFIVLLLVGLGHSTYIRNSIWKTDESLWLDSIEKYPNLWRPYHNLGKYYSDRHQNEKAIMIYNMALNKKVMNNRMDRYNFFTYFNIGVQYFKMGKHEKAMEYYLKAETIHQKYGPLQNNIGLILFIQKKYKDAETKFQQALRYQPDLHEALTNLGLLLIKKNNLPLAMMILKKSIQIEPNSRSALMGIGRIHIQTGEYGKALIYSRKTLEKDPSNHLGLLFLAQIYNIIGNRNQMEETLDTLLDSAKPDQLRRLIRLLTKAENQSTIILDRDTALSLLGKACQKKSHVYRDMVQKNIHKKGEPSAMSGSP